MENVDFDYVGMLGFTIYRVCFSKYLDAYNTFKLSEAENSEFLEKRKIRNQIVVKTETVFNFLLEHGIKNGFNIDSILEIPDDNGNTCFQIASQCSFKICNYLLKRNIKINSIETKMMVPEFNFSESTIKMLEKGVNPFVISHDGESEIDRRPFMFETEEAKRLLSQFPRSVHFSIEDIQCEDLCPADCPSKFQKFYCKNGSLVEMTEKNKIGIGGFGMVYRQLFHGKPMAMKCTLLGKIQNQEKLNESILDMEDNISELRIQIASAGSGVIMPVAFVRQQIQEKDEKGIWIAENYDIYIYPLYDCNLYELHKNHYDQFTDEILDCILHQCLTRKGSKQGVTEIIFELVIWVTVILVTSLCC